jgi:hypothetical protein
VADRAEELGIDPYRAELREATERVGTDLEMRSLLLAPSR